jgi:hypothetical protein
VSIVDEHVENGPISGAYHSVVVACAFTVLPDEGQGHDSNLRCRDGISSSYRTHGN